MLDTVPLYNILLNKKKQKKYDKITSPISKKKSIMKKNH